jgi:hypothetical protein
MDDGVQQQAQRIDEKAPPGELTYLDVKSASRLVCESVDTVRRWCRGHVIGHQLEQVWLVDKTKLVAEAARHRPRKMLYRTASHTEPGGRSFPRMHDRSFEIFMPPRIGEPETAQIWDAFEHLDVHCNRLIAKLLEITHIKMITRLAMARRN